jgi:parallel beta-helix repeat protein
LSAAATVNDCNVQNNGNAGIYCVNSSVSGCTAYNNVYGIRVFNGTVANCIATYNSNLGISVQYGTVSGCHAENNGIYGIYASPGMVTGCYSRLNNGSGIYVDAPGSEVVGNNCIANNPTNSATAAGIYVNDARNRIEDNHLYNNGYAGIQVSSSLTYINNVIIKNSVIGTVGANYITPNAQIVGPLITTTGTITNSNPWANFSF